VTLIDRAEHHLFQPMLYQRDRHLVEGKIAAPLRQLLAKQFATSRFVIAR
jgi:NADH dehydrogenase FAD-containing subunit